MANSTGGEGSGQPGRPRPPSAAAQRFRREARERAASSGGGGGGSAPTQRSPERTTVIPGKDVVTIFDAQGNVREQQIVISETGQVERRFTGGGGGGASVPSTQEVVAFVQEQAQVEQAAARVGGLSEQQKAEVTEARRQFLREEIARLNERERQRFFQAADEAGVTQTVAPEEDIRQQSIPPTRRERVADLLERPEDFLRGEFQRFDEQRPQTGIFLTTTRTGRARLQFREPGTNIIRQTLTPQALRSEERPGLRLVGGGKIADVGSFFVPGIALIRTATFGARLVGRATRLGPVEAVRQEPSEFAFAGLLGAGGVARGVSRARAVDRVGVRFIALEQRVGERGLATLARFRTSIGQVGEVRALTAVTRQVDDLVAARTVTVGQFGRRGLIFPSPRPRLLDRQTLAATQESITRVRGDRFFQIGRGQVRVGPTVESLGQQPSRPFGALATGLTTDSLSLIRAAAITPGGQRTFSLGAIFRIPGRRSLDIGRQIGPTAPSQLQRIGPTAPSQLQRLALANVQSAVSAAVKTPPRVAPPRIERAAPAVTRLPRATVRTETPRVISGQQIAQVSIPRAAQAQVPAVSTAQIGAQRGRQAAITSPRLAQVPRQAPVVVQTPRTQQTQRLITLRSQVILHQGGQALRPPVLTPFLPRTPPRRTPPFIPRLRGRAAATPSTPRFTVEVRRFGQFRTIGRGLSLQRAFTVGRGRVARTLAATFRVRPATPTGRPVQLKTPAGFRRGREAGTFIERRRFRLSRAGEVREIQTARRSASPTANLPQLNLRLPSL